MKCNAYGISKAKRQVRREPRELIERPGDRIAIDFHDFNASFDKFTSLMLITDRWSGMEWDFYMTDRKADAIIFILDFLLKHLEHQYQLRTRVIECDGEIVRAHKIDRFLKKRGIRTEPSPPNTQKLNRAAKRSGGVIKDTIRAIRAGAKLPDKL